MESRHIFNRQFESALDLSLKLDSCAVVSLIFRLNPELEILFIRRAHNPEDRWSGQIAFPGGRMEANESHLQTALRECQEEIGLNLQNSTYLGALDDIQARKAGGLLPFYVRPLIFNLSDNFKSDDLVLDPAEVDEVFWLPFDQLLASENHVSFQFPHPEIPANTSFPGVKLRTGDTLWGLSYIMLTDLLNKTGQRPDFWKEYLR